MKVKGRRVRVDLRNGAYFVLFVDREPGGRYSAGQFDASSTTREAVVDWARGRGHRVDGEGC